MIRGLPYDVYYSGYASYQEISHTAEAMPSETIALKAAINYEKYKTYPDKVLIYTTYPEMIKTFELKLPNVKFLT